jgi:anti-anti-sigma factor
MEHTTVQTGDSVAINLAGRFTFADNKVFGGVINDIVATQCKKLIIDLSLVEFIDSAALGILLLIRDKCEKSQVILALKNPQGQVKHMFEVSRFNDLFKIED